VLSAYSDRHVQLSVCSDVLHIILIDVSVPVHDAVYIGVFIDVAKFRLYEEEAIFLEIIREVVVALSSITPVPIHQYTRSYILTDLNLHEPALRTTYLAS
jgi:hypothetical protein